MSRWELFDSHEKRPAGVIGKTANQKIAHHLVVCDGTTDERKQLPDFGAEREQFVRIDVVERLDPKAIARTEKSVCTLVMDGERPHAVEAIEALFAPADIG